MLITPPKIDKRDFQKLLEEARRLAPFYVPEWDINCDGDSGVALLKIFFHMLQEVMSRLNEVPEKNFIAFLDTLGVKLVPAQPSNVPLAFQLATGAPNVLVPELTQAEASATEEHEALIFETEKNILATTASLTDIYSVVPTRDEIFDYFQKLNDSKDFELFVNQNKQEHALYLGHEDLFNITGEANIQLTISPFPEQLLEPELVSWQYYGKKVQVIDGQEVETPGWYNFDFGEKFQQSTDQITLVKNDVWQLLFSTDLKYQDDLDDGKISTDLREEFEANGITLSEDAIVSIEEEGSKWLINDEDNQKTYFVRKNDEDKLDIYVGEITEIISYKINDIETRWIRCLLEITVTIADYVPAGATRFQVDNTLGISENDQLQIVDWETTDDTEKVEFVTVASVSGTAVNIQGKLKYAHDKGTLVKRVRDISEDWEEVSNLKIDTIGLNTSPKEAGIDANLLFSNDVPLDPSNPPVYPFGKQPRLFDTFYIASQEAFSKKGAAIELNMKISRKQTGISVRRVQGIGEIFAAKLEAEGIKTVEQLLQLQHRPEQLAIILGTNETRAKNILEAARKEFFDKSPPQETTTDDETTETTNGDETGEELTLSWEYWDGQGWTVIKELEDGTNNLTIDGIVTFTCPEDIAATSVVGQENSWIRVRIVSGDYGKEKFVFDENENTWKSDTTDIDPPEINSLKITYSLTTDFDLQHCLTYNNLDFQDVTQKSQIETELFQPFQPIKDEHQTLYLGFDKPLLKGPISLFFSLEEQQYPDENRPRVQWYYYSEDNEWVRLEVVDGTENLTRSGTIELLGPTDFAEASWFEKERYWFKAVDIEDRFQTSKQSVVDVPLVSSESPCNSDEIPDSSPLEPCPEESQVFPLLFAPAGDVSPAPKVKGIYLNSTWALQAATIRNEILGSSDGTQLQAFQFAQTPVFSAEVQVNEVRSISEDEKQSLMETEGEEVVSEVTDASGKPTETWVRWAKVDDFFDSTPESRHYIINRVSGEIQFGDGVQGMIPPIGKDNIRATYQSGGGKDGNVEASEIQTLKTSIPFVDKVNNPDSAGGGSDTETVDKALERGPQLLRNRGRAVTFEDYEWLAKEASPDIARVECLPNFNNAGNFEPGWVTVVLVPESSEEKPVPSPLLLRKVENYLQNRCSNVVVSAKRLQVVSPDYIKVSVTADIYPTSIDLASIAENKSVEALKAFLHPLTGGADGAGWEFGRMVCFSDLYAILEEIAEIDHVEHLSMTLEGDGQKMTFTSENPAEISIPPYALIYSGEHSLTPKQ